MLSLMSRAFEPSTMHQNKLMYLNSVRLNHSICSDNIVVAVDNITELLTSSDTRLDGLTALEIALTQNSDVFLKARWPVALIEFLRDNSSDIVKEHACRVLCIAMTFLSKDPASATVDVEKYVVDLYTLLLSNIDENVTWTESASKLLLACLQNFPKLLGPNKEPLVTLIAKKASYFTSSKTFEVLAECYCEVPNCMRTRNMEEFKKYWKHHFCLTLKTWLQISQTFLSEFIDDPSDGIKMINMVEEGLYEENDEEEMEDDSAPDDVFNSHFRRVYQLINLSKCLTMLLNKKTKFDVDVPLQPLLAMISKFFNIPEKIKPTTIELQLNLSTLVQIQGAVLNLLEVLILNFDLKNFSPLISTVINSAMNASKLSIACEPISELRFGTLKIIKIWIDKQALKLSNDFAAVLPNIVNELLSDINPESEEKTGSSQSNSTQGRQQSKRTAPISPKTKSCYEKKTNHHLICKESLKILESVVYTEGMSKNIIKQIYDEIFNLSHYISSATDVPCPYDDASCRKNLYSVLLAIISIAKPENGYQIMEAENAATVFRTAMQDTSYKVTRLCRRAVIISKIHVSSKRPLSGYSKGRQESNVSREIIRQKTWGTQEYKPNLPVEIVPEISSRVGQAFCNLNENEMHTNEYVEVEPHYSAEIECNGEEAQSSSQGQEVESDEDDDDDVDADADADADDDEEVEEEEEMNPDENMVLPDKLQTLNPVHINQDTVQTLVEPEYEPQSLCARTEANDMDNGKNIQLNGVCSIVPDDDAIASSSNQPTPSNENGVYDESIEEIGDEEEVDNVSFPAEKKDPELYEPPVKRQKIETNEVNEEENERDARSPTLSEMKADFICNEVEDVRS